jgi:hypothetical protein
MEIPPNSQTFESYSPSTTLRMPAEAVERRAALQLAGEVSENT